MLFSLLSQTPISSLFPYTTLFRSEPAARRTSRHRAADAREPGREEVRRGAHRRQRGALHVHRDGAGARRDGLDRKSTRLNSSHGSSSYAVFCLKKKIYIDIGISAF